MSNAGCVHGIYPAVETLSAGAIPSRPSFSALGPSAQVKRMAIPSLSWKARPISPSRWAISDIDRDPRAPCWLELPHSHLLVPLLGWSSNRELSN